MRILGIDPGVATIGFGLVEAERAQVRLQKYGVITTPAGLPLSTRLFQISQDLSR
ncbi:MAG: crossover junction endodeoxyribonuclease RuvC, partial [Oscillospiraceae bacterium]|nr:crossover junction endodeoxyribonuclease RuvC [Oscillospiraceae bacterium]